MAVSQSQNGAVNAYPLTGGVLPPLVTPQPLPSGAIPFQFWAQPVYQASDGTYWSPGFDGPTFATNPWDYIQFGTNYGQPTAGTPANKSPGICRINVGKGYDVDTKKPTGAHGSRNTFTGMRPAGHKHESKHSSHDKMPFEIEFEIWTPEQWRQLMAMWAYLVPQTGKGTEPVGVGATHPLFTHHGITGMQFVSGDGPVLNTNRRGIFKAKAVEFAPPPKNSSTSSAVATAVAVLGTAYQPVTPPLPGATGTDVGPR